MKRQIILTFFVAVAAILFAQNNNDSIPPKFSRLSLGGYGEAAYSRNFFSDSPFRYMKPESHAGATSHGRFDLPHVVFFVGYEFGSGWRLSTEIEFEHGGTEAAMEVEAEEGGEYEQEIERGGEVALEQFWLEKTFSRALNVRIGHIIVPIGYTNANHLPNEFFTVYRPQGEATIFPCTWHETGVSVWGFLGKWRYEAMLLPSLDSELFSNTKFVGNASASPYEFRVANNYAGLLRIDNYSLKNLRIGVAGYYGHTFRNSLMPTYTDTWKAIKGALAIGSFDFEFDNKTIIARGWADYAHLSDAQAISSYNRNLPKQSPSSPTNVASDAIATGVELGIDIFSLTNLENLKRQKLYLFGRYEYYDSMFKTSVSILDEKYCGRQHIAFGINYFPLKEIVVKAEYTLGILEKPFNNEPSINIGIAYTGFFK